MQHTGQKISSNLLRDSFVTHVYSANVSQELKESIARCMVRVHGASVCC